MEGMAVMEPKDRHTDSATAIWCPSGQIKKSEQISALNIYKQFSRQDVLCLLPKSAPGWRLEIRKHKGMLRNKKNVKIHII